MRHGVEPGVDLRPVLAALARGGHSWAQLGRSLGLLIFGFHTGLVIVVIAVTAFLMKLPVIWARG